MNFANIGCEAELTQVSSMLDAWKEILSKQDQIEQDIQSLYKVKGVISQINQKLVLL